MMYYHRDGDGRGSEVNNLPVNVIFQKASPFITIFNVLHIIASDDVSLSEKKKHFKDVIVNGDRVGALISYFGKNFYIPSSINTLRDYIDEDFVYAILVEFNDYPFDILMSILGATHHNIDISEDFAVCAQSKECKRKINLFKLKYPNAEVLDTYGVRYKGRAIL